MVVTVIVVAVVIVLLVLAVGWRIFRNRRSLQGLSPEEKIARKAEQHQLHDEQAANRAETQARNAAGSGAAQSQNRQF